MRRPGTRFNNTILSCIILVTLPPAMWSCASVAHHGNNATPQRPTFSSDTSTTSPGTLEIEAGGTLDPGDEFSLPMNFKLGVSESAEVFVGWTPYQWVERQGQDGRGQGDVLLGTRQRLVDESESRPSFAYQLAGKLPTASERDGLGSGELDLFVAGIATKSLENITCTGYYQLGFLGEPDDDGFDLEHGAALSLAAPVIDQWSVFGEVAGTFHHEQSEYPVFTTIGMAYTPVGSVVFDCAAAIGLNSDAPDLQLNLGLTMNMGRIFAPRSP